MAAPSVYSAIVAIASELAPAGLAKNHFNSIDQYQYRSIDDLLDRLAPLLAKHRLCILPRVLERLESERDGLGEGLLLHVKLKVAFDLVSADDGSSHRIESFGEALDHADKGTAKAMSAAYKSAMLQAFCVPVSGDDPDAQSPRLKRREPACEPVQGWSAWARDIADIICVCETDEALRSVQTRNRELLLGLARAQPQLYKELGEAVTRREQELKEKSPARTAGNRPAKRKRTARAAKPAKEPEHA